MAKPLHAQTPPSLAAPRAGLSALRLTDSSVFAGCGERPGIASWASRGATTPGTSPTSPGSTIPTTPASSPWCSLVLPSSTRWDIPGAAPSCSQPPEALGGCEFLRTNVGALCSFSLTFSKLDHGQNLVLSALGRVSSGSSCPADPTAAESRI